MRKYAVMIPDIIRSEYLVIPTDPIAEAVPYKGNPHMQVLFKVWYEFIEPASQGNIECGHCLNRIIDNFKAMKPELVKLEKEYRILKELTK